MTASPLLTAFTVMPDRPKSRTSRSGQNPAMSCDGCSTTEVQAPACTGVLTTPSTPLALRLATPAGANRYDSVYTPAGRPAADGWNDVASWTSRYPLLQPAGTITSMASDWPIRLSL